jgi:hypothetical protein
MAEKIEGDGGGASSTTEPAAGSSTGTDVSLRDYFFALRQSDERLRQADLRFAEERDRRYQEVALEREKALKIKETADLAALGLAREIQTYKDEKANDLREQISNERGDYLTRTEYTVQHKALEDTVKALDASIQAQLRPIIEYIAGQQGSQQGSRSAWSSLNGTLTIILTMVGLAIAIIIAVTR